MSIFDYKYPVNAFGKARPIEWPAKYTDRFIGKTTECGTLFVYCTNWPNEEGCFIYTTIEDRGGSETIECERCAEAFVNLNERDGVISFREKSSGDAYSFDVRESVRV